MSIPQRLRQWRQWFPVPTPQGRFNFIRWILLEGHRLAVAGAILTFVYVVFLGTGIFWTIEMQTVLTETSTVENILDTFMSGIILLVSIVVSINSIVLSQDIASVQNQEDRTRGTKEFRNEIGALAESDDSPSDPRAFLQLMATVITNRAQTLANDMEGVEEEFGEEIKAYSESISDSIDHLVEIDKTPGGDFSALWMAIEVDYGRYLDRSRALRNSYREELPESSDEQWDSLIESIQLFAIGRENFKTLYYFKEISTLSRTLLVVSLPAILVTATAILAINASLLPEFWVFGLPPLQSFVATVFTISLIPYIVLTSYMLRLSTVAIRTATGGSFSLNN